jgi:predicted ATPase/DNA-binding CsgD family transcriptional regulator
MSKTTPSSQHDARNVAEKFVPPATGRVRHNLPSQPTPLIGRGSEVAAVVRMLRRPDVRLLTLVGLGGAGKTRLAIQVAEELIADGSPALLAQWERGLDVEGLFPDGVLFVSLASLGEPGVIAAAIAQAAGIREEGARSLEALVQDWLREKHMILLLDNFEHVLEGALFVAALLGDAPALKIIATSRERLNVRGEHVFELAGLSLPDDSAPAAANRDRLSAVASSLPSIPGWSRSELEQSGALQLFLHTARALTPSFELSDESLPAAVQTCRLVEGLPLGIEMAAAWTRFLSCDEIAHELAQNLDFLSTASQDAPARHQGLRGVFSHSWELLTLAEQQALRRLGLFRGSFTREAAAAVIELRIENGELRKAPDTAPTTVLNSQFSILHVLAALADKSLIRRRPAAGGARYEVHDIVRQYAAEQLERAGELRATAARFAAYYIGMLEARLADLRGPGQLAALAAIEAEIEHVRTAWRWAAEQPDHSLLGRAADRLFHFYDMRSWFQEGADTFGAAARALAAGQADGGLAWARMLARQGWFTFHMGHQAEARSMLEQSLECMRALDARAEMTFALNYLAAVCSYLGEYQATYALCQESLDITQSLGDLYGQQVACNILGQAVHSNGDYATAKQWFQLSLALSQQIGNSWSLAFSLTNLGNVAYALGEYAEARRLLEEGLQIRQATGDGRGVAICFNRLGDTAVALREYSHAEERYMQSLSLFREIGNQWGMAAALLNLGRLACAQGRFPAAAHALQDALRLSLGTQSAPQVLAIFGAFAALLRAGGEPAWAGELDSFMASEPGALAAYLPHAERILAWSSAPSALESAVGTADKSVLALGNSPPAPARASGAALPAGLTSREIEVLRLVAQGLTDAQVAERLILSRRTVSTHLTSIYSKLQVASRSAATRFAVEHGLV